MPGETFGVSDQFKAGDVLPAGYLTDDEALPFIGQKLEVVLRQAQQPEPVVKPALFVADETSASSVEPPVKPTKSK